MGDPHVGNLASVESSLMGSFSGGVVLSVTVGRVWYAVLGKLPLNNH